jgi:hypothetical protein
LFNCGFPDLRQVYGGEYPTSPELSKLWPDGFHTVRELNFGTAFYTAKYCLKKLNPGSTDESKARFRERYEVFDNETGEVFTRKPEFAVMSLRPGIGFGYYEKYGDSVRALDNCVVDGRYVKPPRYYDILSERFNAEKYALNKRVRRRKALVVRANEVREFRRVNDPNATQDEALDARLRVKERLLEITAERSKRDL